MERRTIGYIVLAVLGVAAAGWLGVSLYEAGFAQGAAAERSEIVTGGGYPYYPGVYGFGVFGIMFRALFALLFFGLVARLFFFRPWAHRGWRGPRGGFGPGGPDHHEAFRSRMEDHLTEWHERAHAESESITED